VLQSVSRLMNRVASPEHQAAAEEARRLLASYRQVEDLVNVGAYERGSDPETDRAINAYPALVDFLQQGTNEVPDRPPAETLQRLLREL